MSSIIYKSTASDHAESSEQTLASLIKYWDIDFAVELLLLLISMPLLYRPTYCGAYGVVFAIALLAGGWVWRRVRLGVWYQKTPADWALVLLLAVMLPVSIWSAPAPLRMEYSWPRALTLLWDFQLFTVIVSHVSRGRNKLVPALGIFIGIGIFVVVIAPFGTNWLFKLPQTETILSWLPSVFGVLSREGGFGFHPNIVSGALLYLLPLMIALSSVLYDSQHRNPMFWLFAMATLYSLAVFLMLQSRGGYIGLSTALLIMPAFHLRWWRVMLIVGGLVAVIGLILNRGEHLPLSTSALFLESVGGLTSFEDFRMELWKITLVAIADFPYTGLGLGVFPDAVRLLYTPKIMPSYYFGHAHNFWLQGAVDFGIPGLVAIMALYLTAIMHIWYLWRNMSNRTSQALVIGLAGSLIAQSIYSMTDSIPMGSTGNLFFWFLFGLIYACGNLVATQENEPLLP